MGLERGQGCCKLGVGWGCSGLGWDGGCSDAAVLRCADGAAEESYPGARSTFLTGEPLSAFKKPCNLHLATARIKRRAPITGIFIPSSCPSALKITERSIVASRLLCTQVQPG